MLRYYQKNLFLLTAAMLISILTRLLVPVTALVEKQIIDLITAGNFAAFQRFLLIACVVVIASALLCLTDALTQKKFQARCEEALRNDFYDGVMRQSVVQFGGKDTSAQMSRIKSYASMIANNLTGPVLILIGYGVMAAVVLLTMLRYSPLIALISMACAVLSTVPPLFFNRKLGENLAEKLNKDAAMTFQLKESLNGHETVTAFGAVRCVRERFFRSSRDMANADYKTQVSIALMQNVAQVAQKITWFLAFLFAGSMAARGDITLGTMMMFITLFSEFNACVTLFAQTVPILIGTRPNIREALRIIDGKADASAGKKAPSFEKNIEVIGLSFRYADDIPVLEDLDLTIRKNEKIALIGASGSGKSTLVRLLSGYHATYSGEIRYDGVELRDMNPQALPRLVTVIHQNMFIFNDSIRFNICMGEPFSDEALHSALLLSGVNRFLADVPGGLDGACGENGSLLSGGQRQRIALARALIRGVRFLIMDEGVSAIDVETANEIEQELLRHQDLTLLTITHRIKDGLIGQYDRVLTMEGGKLVSKTP